MLYTTYIYWYGAPMLVGPPGHCLAYPCVKTTLLSWSGSYGIWNPCYSALEAREPINTTSRRSKNAL